MRDAEAVGDLLLRHGLGQVDAEAHGDDLPLARRQPGKRAQQQRTVDIVLERAHDAVRLGAEDVREQQLVPVPVRGQRLVERDLGAAPGDLAQIHQDLVLDAARGVGGEFDLAVAAVGADRLDETDRADRDQILRAHAARFELAREKNDKTEIVLDERAACAFVTGLTGCGRGGLLLGRQRRRKDFAAADVIDGRQTAKLSEKRKDLFEFHDFLPFTHRSGPRTVRTRSRADRRRTRSRAFFRRPPARGPGGNTAAGRSLSRRRGMARDRSAPPSRPAGR